MSCQCGCPGGCGELPTRFPITNPSGLAQVSYRVGTFASFRRALLRRRDGEVELDGWQPSAVGDLGLQVLDWWAYVADVLTFYTERIANEDYLGTAVLADSVRDLVALLGYRPRPGIAATVNLAVLAATPGPLVVPSGVAIASKATTDVASQTFETTATTRFAQPTSVAGPVPEDLATAPATAGPPDAAPPGTAEPPPHLQLIARGGVLVRGKPTVSVGDRLLLTTRSWIGVDQPAAVVTVTGTAVEKDPHGRANTRVLLAGTAGLPPDAVGNDYRLARATRIAHLATLPSGAPVVSGGALVLDAPARHLKAGDALLVEVPGGPKDVVRLSQYQEGLWYANAPDATKPGTPPTGGAPGIPLVVATLSVDVRSGVDLPGSYGSQPARVTVHSGWADVGILLDTPVRTLTALPSRLTLARPPAAAAGVATTALLEDRNGTGVTVSVTPDGGSGDVTVSGPDATLEAPLRLLWDLITVSRGATVRNEELGTGDVTRPGQDFTLAKSPVTFRADHPGRSGDGYSSTVVLAVGGRYWTEVRSLYGHGATEAVFETYNDEQGRTHVRTGDGEHGARLPTGAPVVATYRVGSGAAVPPATTLTQVLTAVPNLRAVRNPVPPSGGSDPEPADRIRTLAPRSVLTFDRAISGDDYAAVAAAAPGVTRASAVWQFDAVEQRPTVRVYVGDDAGAVDSARAALRDRADPNRPVLVVPAVPCRATLRAVLRIDAGYVPEAVYGEVRTALLALFAPGVLALGAPLYRSRLERVITDVPGVLATHDLRMRWRRPGVFPFGGTSTVSGGPRFSPGPGGFFTITPERVLLPREENGDA